MFLGGVCEAYDVIIIVPFTVLGGIGGHSVSESLGRKADKRAYAELARRKQEREQVEQKKAEIIAKIDEELGEQGGNIMDTGHSGSGDSRDTPSGNSPYFDHPHA